jgi:hypothetical protein
MVSPKIGHAKIKAEIGAKVKEIPAVEGGIHPNAHIYDANWMAAPTIPR